MLTSQDGCCNHGLLGCLSAIQDQGCRKLRESFGSVSECFSFLFATLLTSVLFGITHNMAVEKVKKTVAGEASV